MIYDELDLPLGTIRIRQRGSSAGHNGMESIIGALGTRRSFCESGWESRPSEDCGRREVRADAVQQARS